MELVVMLLTSFTECLLSVILDALWDHFKSSQQPSEIGTTEKNLRLPELP